MWVYLCITLAVVYIRIKVNVMRITLHYGEYNSPIVPGAPVLLHHVTGSRIGTPSHENRMTHTTENITFPRTAYVVGNSY